MRGGAGTVEMVHFLEKEESFGKGRLFSVAVIPPGASIGKHTHTGDFEIYYILKGVAHVMDNDAPAVLEPGDRMLCVEGDSHSIENRGTETVECLCIVLYDEKKA